jgi:PAS domain S-box-containing protein
VKTAKEIMSKSLKFIQSGAELNTTVEVFLESGIHFSPVITPTGEVLGLLSEIGLIRASLRNYLDAGSHEKIYAHKDLLEPAGFASEDATIEEVIGVMLKTSTRRVLIKNKDGKSVGIISPRDILGLLHGTQGHAKDLKAELSALKDKTDVLQKKLIETDSAREKFENIFEDSPYMIHGVNEAGKIVLANKKIHLKLGYEPNELIGKSINELYPSSMIHMALDGLKQIIAEGVHSTTYTTMVTKKGDKMRVDITSSSVKDANQKFFSTISISREVDSDALLRSLNGAFSTNPQKV